MGNNNNNYIVTRGDCVCVFHLQIVIITGGLYFDEA